MLDSVILWRQCKSEEGRWGQTMLNDEVGAQHSYVANALGVDAETMNNHPYDLKLLKGGSLLVCWHDQAPDGVIRDGKLGSYTTLIPSPADPSFMGFQRRLSRTESN